MNVQVNANIHRLPQVPNHAGEFALHFDDVLTRRTWVSVTTAHRGTGSAPEVARLMAGPLIWDAEQVAREVEHYARVEAEREWQRMPDDRTPNAARTSARRSDRTVAVRCHGRRHKGQSR